MKATAILFGRGQRHYRDDDDAVGLVELMRQMVAEEWRRDFGESMEQQQQRGPTGAELVDGGDEEQAGPVSVGTARENNLPLLHSRAGGDGASSRAKGGRL